MKSRCTKAAPPLLPSAAAAARCLRKFVSGQLDEENPFVLISSALLVQPNEGVSVLFVDRIGDKLPQPTEKSRVLVIPVGARHKCQQAMPPAPAAALLLAHHMRAATHNVAHRARHHRALAARWIAAGRTLVARWPRDCGAMHARWSRVSAGGVERCFAGVAAIRCRIVRDGGGTMLRRRLEAWRHGLVAGRPKCVEDGARSRMKRRSSSGRPRALVPPRFFVAAAAGRPPLRRRSGDVVTAGLIFLGFGSGLSRAAREVFGPVCDAGPGFDRF
ncbi:hypothetical protein F511_27227 [Dorcoceras hygrometricum]|uniref:Uncharacterized protein n=1 Tax=Dorcoceras hygrometricum TaxID=472368 RepID=A0A2Z7BE31_9LAMI|nr:hypothetical protein F511_27227 [Dorcoceras hygrometricum]